MHNSPTIRLTSQGYGVNQIKETGEVGQEEKLNCVCKKNGRQKLSQKNARVSTNEQSGTGTRSKCFTDNDLTN